MLNISDNSKAIWQLDSVKKTLAISIPSKSITLGNSDIKWEKLELTETLESESQLNFTGCNAARLKFECKDLTTDIRGEYIEASITAEGADTIPLFCGYVETQERPNSDDISCNITAYDALYKLRTKDAKDWFNALTFPMTLANFRSSLVSFCGLQLVSTTLIFDSLVVKKTINPESISVVDLLKSICRLNGVYGRINRYGKFQFLRIENNTTLYPALTLYPSTTLYPTRPGSFSNINKYKSVEYENYLVDKIDKVQIHDSENDIGGIYGNGANAYIVENNWLTYGRTAAELATMASTLYAQVSNYTYYPATINAPSIPYAEIGDYIEFKTTKSIITTYILSRTIKGIQVIEDKFIASGNKVRRKSVEDVNYQVEQLAGKTNKLTRTVEETNSKIDDVEKDLSSEISQTAEAIKLKVSKGDVSSEISQEAGAISISANRISITSTNFTLQSDGTMTCENATVRGYTTTTELNATNGRVTTLETNSLTADNINSKTFTLDSGHIGSLDASKITSGTIDADRITTDTVTSKISAASGISAKTITCSSYTVQSPTGSGHLYTLRPTVLTVGSKSRVLLSADYAE